MWFISSSTILWERGHWVSIANMRIAKFLFGQARWIGFLFTGLWFISGHVFAHSPHDDAFDVAVSPKFHTDKTVYAIVRNNFLRSTNGGKTWDRIVRGLDHSHTLHRMALANDGRTIYLASLGDGIYRSTDAGETWTNASAGLDSAAIDRIAVAPGRPGFALAAGVIEGLFVTDNGGESWRRLTGSFGKITAITITATEVAKIFIGDEHGSVYESGDYANSWILRVEVETPSAIMDIAVAPSQVEKPFILFGTASGDIFRSVDNGSGFKVSRPNSSGLPIVSIVMSPDFLADGIAMATSWEEGVYCTNTNGMEWHRCAAGLTTDSQAKSMGRPSFSRMSMSPQLSQDGTVFVAGFDGLFRTTDQGSHWEELESLSPVNIVGLGVSPNYGADRTLVVTNWMWGAYRSEDGGQSWQSINVGARDKRRKNGLTCLFSPVFSPAFAKDQTILSSTWWRMLKTEDRGDSWRQVVPMDEPVWTDTHHASIIVISPAYASDSTLLLASHRGPLLRSRDGGESFEVIRDFGGFIGSVALSPDYADDQTMFVGDTRGIHRSVDDGQNWSFVPLVAADLAEDIPISPAYPRAMASGWLSDQQLNRDKEIAVSVVVAPSFSRLGVVFASTPNGLFRSKDGGESWREIGGTELSEAHIEALAVSPDFANDGTVIVSVLGRGHFRSRDHGESFQEIATTLSKTQNLLANYAGVMPRVSPIVFSPNYARDRMIFGFSGPRLFSSQDGGENWRTLMAPTPDFLPRTDVWFRSLPRRWRLVSKIGLATATVFVGLTLYWLLRRTIRIASRSDVALS